MANILGIQAFSSGTVLETWWEYALVAIICASGLIGIIAFLWASYNSFKKWFRTRTEGGGLSRSIQEFFYVLTRSAERIRPTEPLPEKPSSFGVFLGSLSTPPADEEREVLAGWAAVVLDYRRPGVLEAVSNTDVVLGPHIIARLDLPQILPSKATENELDKYRAVYVVSNILQESLRQPDQRRYFTGVLVAGWEQYVSMPLLNGLAKLFAAHGLGVFLEVGPPDYLHQVENLDLNLFAGIVVRNGTIMRNGERRDFFAMDKMKTTTKAFVSQACLRPFITMMWDTIADEAELSHAVTRRAHMWCSYHGAIPYFVRQGALTDMAEIRSCEEPLAAFQWLKDRRVMNVHEKFRTTRILAPEFSSIIDDYLPLQEVFPLLQSTISGLDSSDSEPDESSSCSTLTVQYPEIDENGALLTSEPISPFSPGFNWSSAMKRHNSNPLSCSADGTRYGSLGCFPIGLNATQADFEHVLKSQERLRHLNLLSKVTIKELHAIGNILHTYSRSESSLLETISNSRAAVTAFADALLATNEEDEDYRPVRVYTGIDSGFHTPSGSQFWSVWEVDRRTSSLIIYLSKSAQDLPSTLLHTYLSKAGFSRYQCFLLEFNFSEHLSKSETLERLPSRMEQDLELLSSSDLVLYLQHLQHTEWDGECPLLTTIRTQCEELLIDVPTYRQLKRQANLDYISEDITDENLVNARIKWYRLCHLPSLERHNAVALFRHVDLSFRNILWWRDHRSLDVITSAIEKLTNRQNIDSVSDFVLFCIFCAARKAAFEEVYIEVSDRNPLFNQYSDQSAAFAELFALGSRCEAYFDIRPSDIGVLLSKKHRSYYNEQDHQPPMWIFNAPSFASAYAAAQTDIDPKQKASVMPGYRRFTFLSVFAIPALVDILLLSTTGHGLYLSVAMEFEEQKYATLALMTSLLLSGAIGTWISIGGTYYLISMAFSAANMFVLTRLIGGLAFTLAASLVGFVVIAVVVGVKPAAIYFFYLLLLTSYLSVLAVLSTYQIPGSSFLNGRKVIIAIIPTLIISPIITIWVEDYDIIIYPCILFVFVSLLILGTRRVATQWVTWYHNIKTLNDKDVKDWYVKEYAKRGSASEMRDKFQNKEKRVSLAASSATPSTELTPEEELFYGLSEPAILALCRTKLYDAVMKERNRQFWRKPTTDVFVKTLASCWDSTLFLLDWYCRVTDTKRPIPFSSTWNLETQVALESMQQSQKGIRLHNSFIHWRNAGDEIGCGILYFLVALMDRWLDLVHGGRLVGLSEIMEYNKVLRLSVGFGLAYYLIGAVLLDYKAQHLHQLSEQMAPVSIENVAHIKTAKANDQKFRRHLYWTTLWRFIGVHVWALSLSTALVWIFNGSSNGMIMFLAYVGAYSGLLLYQYNKIFSGPHALMPLLIAVILGFVLGNILQEVQPTFQYNNVIALAAGTWAAALLSFRTAKLGLPEAFDIRMWVFEKIESYKKPKLPDHSTDSVHIRGLPSQYHIHWSTKEEFHAYNGAGSEADWSQSELQAFTEKLRSAPKENRFRVLPFGNPGDQVTANLLSCTHDSLSRLALQAYPAMPFLVQRVVLAWQNGLIKVFIVPMQSVTDESAELRAISHYSNGHLTLYVASDSRGAVATQVNISSNSQSIAETLLHACARTMFGMTRHQAEITESILACRSIQSDAYLVSECAKRTMPSESTGPKAAAFETQCRKEILRHLSFGYDCDKDWDNLPLEIRRMFLRRCMGARGPYTNTEMTWINKHVAAEDSCTILSRIARYDLGAYLAVSKYNYFKSRGGRQLSEKDYRQVTADIQEAHHPVLNRSATSVLGRVFKKVTAPAIYTYHTLGQWIKFFVLACMADLEYQRELKCALGRTPLFIAKPVTFILTGLWIYSHAAMSRVLPFFLYHNRKDIAGLASTVKGSLISQKKDRLIIRSYGETETAFVHRLSNGRFKLVFYTGILKQEPTWGHIRISEYDRDMQITSRKEYKNNNVVSEFAYEYPSKRAPKFGKIMKFQNVKLPISRTCVAGNDSGAKVQYNYKGHIESGSYIQDGNLVRFKYHYRKNAKYDDELLRAEFVLPHMSVNVSWCAPPVRHAEKMERWIPTPRVHEATFVQGADVYECNWLYDHKFHPVISTKLNGDTVDTPDMIRYDWLGVLKKPTHCTFMDENPLLDFAAPTSTFFMRMFGTNIKRQEISTSRARSQLWKAWKKRLDLDGVLVRFVDEELIRKETLLRPYWRRRDRGSLLKAEDYLALHADAIMASSDLTSDISAWTPLAIRMSDLFSFGQGGDAVIFTRTKTLQRDTENNLHVIAVDTGTWPNEGGGVSACRRDLINNLRTIKWHMVVESANDFGLPKHQTEENVESLKIIPLWGLDFMHPSHGMFTNKLDSEVDHLVADATINDIKMNFIPTLTALVRGARAIDMTEADVKQATRALVNLNTYFQDSRHWKEVWTSDIVKDTWRKLWMADDMPNAQPPSEWFRTELPTLSHLDTALELWFRYLFIFSIPIPDKIPNVFQASHHSVSASYGIVCKIKRNCTLQIWDHAISWRETNLYLSSAMCTLPPFIRNSLLGLMKLTSCLILHHADQILPCADFFNPGWEIEIGSAKGQLTHRNVFKRKVDPIVNGITDMQKFSPVTEIKTKQPTVTMLSHVWFAKDIKTALLAADIISNEWGFKDYKLDIYGALNKSPVYSSECQEILACKGLGQSVALKGTADPAMVLANTWLFLNSSVSEGLPLALGEAALTGAPVVCTDVGASLRVLTDPDDGKRYSEVVAPNDAYGLARAQINLLAMLDEWAQYADDPADKPAPILPHKPTPYDVEIITRRMYEKTDQRRKLGMMARNIVQKSFGGERYLREHEQMLWIGKACYEMLGLESAHKKKNTAVPPPPRHPGRAAVSRMVTDTASSNLIDPQMAKMQHPRPPLFSRHYSTATSFSSVYIDEEQASTSAYPPNFFQPSFDWGPSTPDSSVHYYPNSFTTPDNKSYDESYFAPPHASSSSAHMPAPPARTYSQSGAGPNGKRPVKFSTSPTPYTTTYAGGVQANAPPSAWKNGAANMFRSTNAMAKTSLLDAAVPPSHGSDGRRNSGVAMRQSVVGSASASTRSSVKMGVTGGGIRRSHLNEVEVVEYGRF
ncbi:glycosyltransferase family 4 protein [Periconia macrospinosa]|uniref:Glycosyltransferase family 4 protein n=1 Tax=Periconia macrospinosa TaxID=97972 RepID=A0A2V1DKI4_9PLEO|nr:glycosyltransferase family 4 protein [Periconia macrospinosa]